MLFLNAPVQDSLYYLLAKEYGWDVYPNNRTNPSGASVLKDMFILAQQKYNALFYAFANGDILFDNGLVDTLESILFHNAEHERIYITGNRLNTNMERIMRPLFTTEDVGTWAQSKTEKRIQYSAQDYFVISKNSFDWSLYPDLVIGRPGVDNYLTYVALKSKMTIIDGSRTILALHQKRGKSNGDGWINKDVNYNRHLMQRAKIKGFSLKKVLNNRLPYFTDFDSDRNIVLCQRYPEFL